MRRFVLAALCLVAACSTVPGEPTASLGASGGEVTMERGGKTQRVPLDGTLDAPAGARIRTSDGGTGILEGDGARIELLPGSAVVLEALEPPNNGAIGERPTALRLEAGFLSVVLYDNASGPLEVRTLGVGSVALEPPGELYLAIDGHAPDLYIEALKGRAIVRSAGAELVAGAGSVVRARAGLGPFLSSREHPVAGLATVPVATKDARYGALTLSSEPNARCLARFTFPHGLGEGPPPSASGTTDALGQLAFRYATPRIAPGRATYAVTCFHAGNTGEARGAFDVALREITPANLTVRIYESPLDAAGQRPDPDLASRAAKATGQLHNALPNAWRAATRGLGELRVVPEGEDLTVYVIAAPGTSLHRTAKDGSEEILIYVSDERGPLSNENVVAVALHEIAHTWCCRGEGTLDGEWAAPAADPFNLMNHPVRCSVLPSGLQSCPQYFSERDLRVLGFRQIPAPSPR